MMVMICVATFLVFCIGSCQSAQFLLTVPQKPYYDTEYTATVSAYRINQSESVSLEYRGLENSRLIHSTVLTFHHDGIQNWTVVFPWAKMEKLKESAVTLFMNTLYKEEKKTLYFSSTTGYIFIQTDKPLYTPRQTVKFRIIAVDEYQRLSKYPLKVDIKNEKMIVMDRMRYSAEEAFKAQEFELPKETPPGNWTISANFEGTNNMESSSAETVTFEVKEYVLPRFSAELKISPEVITNSTFWINVTVTAKYVYGEDTMGSVEIQLGIWDPKKGLELWPTKHVGNLANGRFQKYISIFKMIPRQRIDRENKRLYINVNVTEEGTGENDTIVDTSTLITHPYYDITHTAAKKHFKPGFPYTLHTQVHARTGRPASLFKVWIEAEYQDDKGKRVGGNASYFPLDQEGKTVQDYDIPSNAARLLFKTIVIDFKAGPDNDDEFWVPVLRSPNKQYLHLALVKPVKKYADGLVKLRYTPPYTRMTSGAPVEQISVLVLARGQVVMSKSVVRKKDGSSTMAIPKSLYTEMSPRMRIVGSFYHTGVIGSEFVVDSLWVKTDDVCLEELSLHKPGGIFASPLPKKPKDKYSLKIKGGPSMQVGMVAVDKAVFLLNSAHTLTRASMFSMLDSHDQGQGNGDGADIEEVMMNSGLDHLLLDTDEREEYIKEEENHRSGHLFDPVVAAHLVKPLNHLRTFFVILNTHRPPPQTPSRYYFPESWLFNDYVLPKSGTKHLDLTLPDSITTWHFMAVGISSTRGVCVSHSLEQRVQKLFFVDVRLPYKVKRLEEVKVRIAIYNYRTDPVTINAVVSGSDGLCFSDNRFKGTEKNSTNFSLKVGPRRSKRKEVKVIPLSNGDQTIKVDVYTGNERDIVERKIYVVAEGLRLRKSVTFVLDPEAKHARYNKPNLEHEVMMADTPTIKNTIDLRVKTQKTQIDLAMPVEIIRGTENCKISAFGDLMGDIIDRAVIQSKSLMDSPVQNAEEVLGDLGPTVQALLYANQSGLMDELLSKKARRFVVHGG